MPVPVVYRRGGENILTSFSFTDIISGLGYVRYYPFVAITNSATSNILSSYLVPTADNVSPASQSNSFSSTFNLSSTIKGKLYLRFIWGARSGGSATQTSFMTFTLKKNGTTIITDRTINRIVSGSGAQAVWTEIVFLEVPETNFGKGDILTIDFTGDFSGGVYTTTFLGHDPESKDITASSIGGGWSGDISGLTTQTDIRVFIPFKIDI